jgi:predicted DNA-binding transcriptional regulator YafY
MIETSARLLRLLALFQARRYWPGAELASRLEVTARTLRRDIDRLRTLGYPVHSTSGVAGGYQLGAGAALPPLLLDDDEAVAIVLGLRVAAAESVAGMEEAAVRALAKLDHVMPARLRKRVNAFQAAVIPLRRSGAAIAAELLSSLAAACRDREAVRFRYRAREGETARRNVEPHKLVYTAARWYLVAWDLDRGNWRTFRVDRIESKPVTGARFAPREPPGGDFAAYVSQSLSTAPYPHQAEVVVHAPLGAIAERIPPGAGFLEAIGEKSCLLRAGSHSLETMSIFLALLGADFEVRHPRELRDHVRAVGARFARAASARASL